MTLADLAREFGAEWIVASWQPRAIAALQQLLEKVAAEARQQAFEEWRATVAKVVKSAAAHQEQEEADKLGWSDDAIITALREDLAAALVARHDLATELGLLKREARQPLEWSKEAPAVPGLCVVASRLTAGAPWSVQGMTGERWSNADTLWLLLPLPAEPAPTGGP